MERFVLLEKALLPIWRTLAGILTRVNVVLDPEKAPSAMTIVPSVILIVAGIVPLKRKATVPAYTTLLFV